MATKISYIIVFLTSLGLIFIGTRFLLSPEIAELSYGIRTNTLEDFSFHYIKGIRDLFSGILILLLILFKQKRALGIAMLAATIVPLGDMLIVLSKDYNGFQACIPHLTAVIICLTTGPILFLNKSEKNNKTIQPYVKLIHSIDNNSETIIESNILPGDKTPWHYHTEFSETFEVLKGRLEVGRNSKKIQLYKGDSVTIEKYDTHYFNNISQEECIVRTTIKPGNKNFETASFILKGFAKDGLSNKSGRPKKITDLALFIYLNNIKMVGFQKIVEPLFQYLAKRSIKKGRLNELINLYC